MKLQFQNRFWKKLKCATDYTINLTPKVGAYKIATYQRISLLEISI